MRIKELTPTPLVVDAERQARIVVEAPGRVRFRSLHLLLDIGQLLLGNLFLWLTRSLTPRKQARRLREFAERQGYLWVKIGQLMAMRNDRHPDEYCNELDKLYYPSVGIPLEVVTKIVEHELGQPLAAVFHEFSPIPFRARFTYQTHRARLHGSDGWVAVKVQRPNLALIFRQDMIAFRRLVALYRWLGLGGSVSWDSVFWELEQAVTAEIDYQYELSNTRRLRRIMLKRDIYVPKVYERYSTSRVLVTEFVPGALVADLSRLMVADPQRLSKWLAENNIDLKMVGQRLFNCFLRQLMEDNLVHGNLNPSNIVLLRDGRFALIDFSLLFTVESEFLRRFVQSMRALATYHYGRAADLTLLLCPELPVIDVTSLKERMMRCFRAWDSRSELKRMPLHEKSLASLYGELSKILYSYGINLSQTFMKLGYTLSTLDDSLCLLIPNMNYSRLFRRHFQGASLRSLRETLDRRSIMEGVIGLKESLTEYQQILGTMLRRGALVFQGGTTKLSDAMATLFRMFRLGSFFFVVVFACKLIDLHFPHIFAITPMDEPLEAIGVQNTDVLLLIIAAAGYFYYMFGKLEKRFRQQDIRLPNTSTPART